MSTYAEVMLSKVHAGVDKIYHYTLPADLHAKIQVGSQVLIPFGSRKTIGYVIGFTSQTSIPEHKLKEVIKVTSSTPLFTEKMVETARWMADYYLAFFMSALRTMMIPGTVQQEKKVLLGKIQNSKSASLNKFKIQNSKVRQQTGLTPTADQHKALDLIKSSIDKEKSDKILLYGVTGSGKTEVYLQAIEYLLSKGKDAIVLVPEISLAPQMIERFKSRFGDLVAVLHSYLTPKERISEWMRISAGLARIVLGTRSAVFAPLKNPGLIVIDEEFEFTFKQEQPPRYHAREVAFWRAQMDSAVVVLGTATPALETFYQACQGNYKLAQLPSRIDNRPLPPVEVVSLKKEKEKIQNSKIISAKLLNEIRKSLENKEQIILFMNRRGFSTFVLCRECGYVIECPECAVSLVFHAQGKILRCHHCGFTCEAAVICPQCQSMTIKYLGAGTQRIELEIAKEFPLARIVRLDRDSLRQHESALKSFAGGEADILIGTQLVTKGLDFAQVGLVGVLNADTALNFPDFRAAEQTFQLLTQVAGRAGRHKLPGRVVIQTYHPDHYAILAARDHDYEKFYNQEIEYRRELNYPPFSKLISLAVSGAKEARVIETAEKLAELLKKSEDFQTLGPAAAAIPKLRGRYRWNILLKGQDLGMMRKAVVKSLATLKSPDSIRITVDVEPLSLL